MHCLLSYINVYYMLGASMIYFIVSLFDIHVKNVQVSILFLARYHVFNITF